MKRKENHKFIGLSRLALSCTAIAMSTAILAGCGQGAAFSKEPSGFQSSETTGFSSQESSPVSDSAASSTAQEPAKRLTAYEQAAVEFLEAIRAGDTETVFKALVFSADEKELNPFINVDDVAWWLQRSQYADWMGTDPLDIQVVSEKRDFSNSDAPLYSIEASSGPLSASLFVTTDSNSQWRVYPYGEAIRARWTVQVPKGCRLFIRGVEVPSSMCTDRGTHDDTYTVTTPARSLEMSLHSDTYGDFTDTHTPRDESKTDKKDWKAYVYPVQLDDERTQEVLDGFQTLVNNVFALGSGNRDPKESEVLPFLAKDANPAVVPMLMDMFKDREHQKAQNAAIMDGKVFVDTEGSLRIETTMQKSFTRNSYKASLKNTATYYVTYADGEAKLLDVQDYGNNIWSDWT